MATFLTLTVSGNATLSAALAVTGAVTMASTLAVTGAITAPSLTLSAAANSAGQAMRKGEVDAALATKANTADLGSAAFANTSAFDVAGAAAAALASSQPLNATLTGLSGKATTGAGAIVLGTGAAFTSDDTAKAALILKNSSGTVCGKIWAQDAAFSAAAAVAGLWFGNGYAVLNATTGASVQFQVNNATQASVITGGLLLPFQKSLYSGVSGTPVVLDLGDGTHAHLNAPGASGTVYLNWAGSGGVSFCDGAGNVVATMDGAGNLSCNSLAAAGVIESYIGGLRMRGTDSGNTIYQSNLTDLGISVYGFSVGNKIRLGDTAGYALTIGGNLDGNGADAHLVTSGRYLCFGSASPSSSALKVVGTTMQICIGDLSAYADLEAGKMSAFGGLVLGPGTNLKHGSVNVLRMDDDFNLVINPPAAGGDIYFAYDGGAGNVYFYSGGVRMASIDSAGQATFYALTLNSISGSPGGILWNSGAGVIQEFNSGGSSSGFVFCSPGSSPGIAAGSLMSYDTSFWGTNGDNGDPGTGIPDAGTIANYQSSLNGIYGGMGDCFLVMSNRLKALEFKLSQKLLPPN